MTKTVLSDDKYPEVASTLARHSFEDVSEVTQHYGKFVESGSTK